MISSTSSFNDAVPAKGLWMDVKVYFGMMRQRNRAASLTLVDA